MTMQSWVGDIHIHFSGQGAIVHALEEWRKMTVHVTAIEGAGIYDHIHYCTDGVP